MTDIIHELISGPHTATLYTKWTEAHHDENGTFWPVEMLLRFECSCGWKGAAWHAKMDRARGHLDRHLPEGASLGPLAQLVTEHDGETVTAVFSL